MLEISLILDNIRSCHNVGSIFRTADGFGIKHLYIAGYTPYPYFKNDSRLPHEYKKTTRAIHKTALGSELNVGFSLYPSTLEAIVSARQAENQIIAIEQAQNSEALNKFHPSGKIALVIGNELKGIDKQILKTCDTILEIPMFGKKESFNAAISAAIAMYSLRFLG